MTSILEKVRPAETLSWKLVTSRGRCGFTWQAGKLEASVGCAVLLASTGLETAILARLGSGRCWAPRRWSFMSLHGAINITEHQYVQVRR